MRLGIAHHFGWAVAVTASARHEVVDRRRIELVGPGLPEAPIHYRGAELLDDAALAARVAEVRESALRTAGAELDRLAAGLAEPIVSISLRAWPPDFPTEIAALRRAPYESQADSVMYREALATAAEARGWSVHWYDRELVLSDAAAVLGVGSIDGVLRDMGRAVGPPWQAKHKLAAAAAIAAIERPLDAAARLTTA